MSFYTDEIRDRAKPYIMLIIGHYTAEYVSFSDLFKNTKKKINHSRSRYICICICIPKLIPGPIVLNRTFKWFNDLFDVFCRRVRSSLEYQNIFQIVYNK